MELKKAKHLLKNIKVPQNLQISIFMERLIATVKHESLRDKGNQELQEGEAEAGEG